MPVEGSTSLFLGNYDLSSKIYKKFWSAMSPPKKQGKFYFVWMNQIPCSILMAQFLKDIN